MNSKDYWTAREAEQARRYAKDEQEYDKQIKRIYSDMLDGAQKEIDGFYGRYADKEGISLAEAKRRVSKLDIEAYERKAAKYVAEKNFSKQANEEMRLYNATMKINRLEMLKANIGLELIAGHDELERFMAEILQGRTEEELKRQAGILGETIKDNAKKAHTIPNASFHNATFSDRIWMNQDLLRAELAKLLKSGMISGKGSRALARELKQKFHVSTANAERLMTTEMRRCQTEAAKQSYEENGTEEYTFLALNPMGACDVCKALDGKHFKVKDMLPGENAPPLHPRCHCATAPYENIADYEAWLDYLDKGGTTAQWNAQKAKNPVAKSGESGIMKSRVVSGARNPLGDKAKDHATKYYGLVRSMKTDAAKIAEVTGVSEQEIQAIKDFVFTDKHDLGGEEPERFEPDYMMAESWRRLMEGKPQKHDITLIRHEQMERQLMAQGVSQDEAHRITSEKYNYDKEANEFYGKIKKYRD